MRPARARPSGLRSLLARVLPAISVGRLGEQEEVARLVRDLVSCEAGFITGTNLAINGGQHPVLRVLRVIQSDGCRPAIAGPARLACHK
nr:SDR family oxidoreductase [Burkholderia ambifaria]